MPNWEDEDDPIHGVVTESKEKLKKPPLYKVLLHNDDFTTATCELWQPVEQA